MRVTRKQDADRLEERALPTVQEQLAALWDLLEAHVTPAGLAKAPAEARAVRDRVKATREEFRAARARKKDKSQ